MIVAVAIAAIAAGCGEEEPGDPGAPSTTTDADAEPKPPAAQDPGHDGEPAGGPPKPPAADKPSGPAEGPGGDPRTGAETREVIAAVRRYVEALDRHDGERVCALVAPGAIEQVELPRERGSCAESVSASIGYRDPRGFPVWEEAEVTQVAVPRLGEGSAKAVATVVTEFADREEYSVEDDVIYLQRRRGQWLVAKPSSTFYRAVGIADPPPTVLAPPQG